MKKGTILVTLLILSLLLLACNGATDRNLVDSDKYIKDIDDLEKRDIDIEDEDIHREVEELGRQFIDALLVWDEDILLEMTDPYIIEIFNRYPRLKKELSISKQALADYDYKIKQVDEELKVVNKSIVMDIHQLISMKSKEPSFTGNYNRYKYDYKISLDIDPYIMRVREVTWDVVPIRLQIN